MRDQVEHIRTVHFTLAALCLGLIVIVSSDRVSKVSRALDELTTIESALQKWDPSQFGALAEAAYKRALPKFIPKQDSDNRGFLLADAAYAWPIGAIGLRSSDKEVVGISGYRSRKRLAAVRERKKDTVSNHFKISLSDQFVFPENCESADPDTDPHTLYPTLPSRLEHFTTVSEFEGAWDCLRKIDVEFFPVIISSSALLNGNKVPLVRDASLPESTRTLGFEFVHLNPNGYESRPILSALRKFGGSTFEDEVLIEEDYLTVDVHLPFPRVGRLVIPVIAHGGAWLHAIEHWQKLAPELIGKNDQFAESFPNLKEVTRNYAGQDFSSIRKQLKEERERAGESFEALGLKLPAGETTRWGLLLIFVVQVYLWIHIRELQRKLSPHDEALNFPWIGLYAGIVARLVFYVSIAILPVIAVLTVGHATGMFKTPIGWVTARSLNVAFTIAAGLVSSGLSTSTIMAHRPIWLALFEKEWAPAQKEKATNISADGL